MNITVIGCGRWGAFLAWYMEKLGAEVYLYGREGSAKAERLLKDRTNGTVVIGSRVQVGCDFEKAMENNIIIIAVASQELRNLMNSIKEAGFLNKTFVLCMKGLELVTNKRLSLVAEEIIGQSGKVAVWLGPGHAEDFVKGIPNCMVIDSNDISTKEFLVESFSSDLIRFYYGKDLLGNEIGAAAKNVIGIAAGMLDGMRLSSLKGGLMSRGTREISRLIKAMGGNELSAYGLCHLGDYEATLFSPHSHNRKFGEMFVQGLSYGELAEGYYAVKALTELSREYNSELPICDAVYSVLYKNTDASDSMKGLFARTIKNEF